MSTPAQKLQAERLRYPGLLPREVLILQAWLRLHESEYDRMEYNVRVGAGQDPGPQWPDDIRRWAVENSRKRIDAVAWQGGQATIVEVKDRAGASAIGQLVVYQPLWEAENPGAAAPRLMLITNRIAPDLLPVLARTGISLALVEADFSSLRR